MLNEKNLNNTLGKDDSVQEETSQKIIERNHSEAERVERSIPQEGIDSILPQISGMFSDVENILRSEKKLLETRISEHMKQMEKGLFLSALGTSVFFLVITLLAVTGVYQLILNFPGIPVWQITIFTSGLLSLFGVLLLAWTRISQKSKG